MIGEQLKKIRKHFGMNQTEFAETLGIKQMTYSHYELNSHEMPFAKVCELGKVHKANLNWLFTGEGPMFHTEEKTPEPKTAPAPAKIKKVVDIAEAKKMLEDYERGNSYYNEMKSIKLICEL